MDEVLEFINRRFKNDCNWTNGNCYFFAVILKSRFPEGEIFYEEISGHFVLKYNNQFYDWTGIHKSTKASYVSWEEFDKYDLSLKKRIVRDCIM